MSVLREMIYHAIRRGNMIMTVHDVASYILDQRGPMTAMKLQKLTYYSQAWSLVFDERPLFNEPIEAWANGPVVPALYSFHRGSYSVSSWEQGSPSNLDQDARETIEVVMGAYSNLSSLELSNLTHSERPWMEARESLEPN